MSNKKNHRSGTSFQIKGANCEGVEGEQTIKLDLNTPAKGGTKLTVEPETISNKSRRRLSEEMGGRKKSVRRIYPAPIMKRVVAFVIDIFSMVGLLALSKYISLTFSKELSFLDKIELDPSSIIERISEILNTNLSQKIDITIILEEMNTIIIFLFFYLFIFVILQSKFRVTLGKLITGVRLVSSNGSGSVSLFMCFLRECLIKPCSLVTIVGVLFIFTNKKRKSLHDYICRSRVISKP